MKNKKQIIQFAITLWLAIGFPNQVWAQKMFYCSNFNCIHIRMSGNTLFANFQYKELPGTLETALICIEYDVYTLMDELEIPSGWYTSFEAGTCVIVDSFRIGPVAKIIQPHTDSHDTMEVAFQGLGHASYELRVDTFMPGKFIIPIAPSQSNCDSLTPFQTARYRDYRPLYHPSLAGPEPEFISISYLIPCYEGRYPMQIYTRYGDDPPMVIWDITPSPQEWEQYRIE